MKTIQSGMQPFDKRTGGLRAGGVYVLAGAPGSGKLAALLQFLDTGLDAGERVALLTSMAPDQVLEQAQHLGFDFDGAWTEGRFRLLGFAADFDRLLLSAAEPAQVFNELGELAGHDVTRLGVDPGKPLWETRAGTSLSSRFLEWGKLLKATILVTVASDLEDTLSPATEWVLQSAAGVFRIDRLPNGLRQLWIRRISPPIDHQGPITLALVPGKGFCEPIGRFDRRRTDTPIGSERRLLLLRLSDNIPAELLGWVRNRYDAIELQEPLRLVSRLQDREEFGVVLVYLDREHSREAAEACRAIRPLTGAPIILATDDRLRATDRTLALDAGANDFLSDNFSLVELASRIERAMQATSGQPQSRRLEDDAAAAPPQAMLEADDFARRIDDRLSDPHAFPFALILFRSSGAASRKLGDVLVEEIRDAGDCVGTIPDGFGVVLQGARPKQAEGYLTRVRDALSQIKGGPADFAVTVISSATDREAIRQAVRVAAA
jgi:KaiC/GvpD/RAD55 family RecA-like ATPase/CheY-like chemotaxis protein